MLPGLETFEGFCLAIGLYLVPVGALMARWQTAAFLAMAANFVPLLAPANQMRYDTVQYYNSALAIVAGSGAAAVSFRLLPGVSDPPTAGADLTRSAPARDESFPPATRRLGGPHIRPACGITGCGRAVAALAVSRGAICGQRDYPTSPS